MARQMAEQEEPSPPKSAAKSPEPARVDVAVAIMRSSRAGWRNHKSQRDEPTARSVILNGRRTPARAGAVDSQSRMASPPSTMHVLIENATIMFSERRKSAAAPASRNFTPSQCADKI